VTALSVETDEEVLEKMRKSKLIEMKFGKSTQRCPIHEFTTEKGPLEAAL